MIHTGTQIKYSISLGKEEHKLALYEKSKKSTLIKDCKIIDTDTLRDISKKAKGISVCFSSRSIYADIGVFSSVSKEATTAHIRSNIDKTGLFNESYAISYKKINDIDGVRSKFSYLAIPLSEISIIELFDEQETLIDIFCPIEAAIATLVNRVSQDMAITIYEDSHYVRIIGSKQGFIYHLITINARDSFDLTADTISGTNEMKSLLKNTYNETTQHIFRIGETEIPNASFAEKSIHLETLTIDGLGEILPSHIELAGNIFTDHYDFIPEKYEHTKKLASYANYSILLSIVLVCISVVLFGLGYRSSRAAHLYQEKINITQEVYLKSLSAMEEEYNILSKALDFKNINSFISMYKDFEAEPKLHIILAEITQRVPKQVFITKIEVSKPAADIQPTANTVEGEAQAQTPSQIKSLNLKIDGIIKSPYPQSKELFSSFLSAMQEIYVVNTAFFHHSDQDTKFTLECEAKQ